MRKLILLLLFGVLSHIAECQAKEPDLLLLAFIEIESSFNADTINHLGYGGILQIGQEMIDEANRISKKLNLGESFILSDRLNVNKSIRIWYIVQNYWNPKYTCRRACKIWNPTASNRYYIKVKNEVIKLLRQNMINKLFEDYYESK